MYLPLSKKPRKSSRSKCARLKAKLGAKNRRRRKGLQH